MLKSEVGTPHVNRNLRESSERCFYNLLNKGHWTISCTVLRRL